MVEPAPSAIPVLFAGRSQTNQWSKLPLGTRSFGTSGSCIVRTSCFVPAGTFPKLRDGLKFCPSQVNLAGIFSFDLNEGDVRSTALAARAANSTVVRRTIVFDNTLLIKDPFVFTLKGDYKPTSPHVNLVREIRSSNAAKCGQA